MSSLKVKHIDLAEGGVDHDAREVATKNSKTFPTFFLPVGGSAREVVADWIGELRALGYTDVTRGFRATDIACSAQTHQFAVTGLSRKALEDGWPDSEHLRNAFAAVGLPYFNLHVVRNTLAAFAE